MSQILLSDDAIPINFNPRNIKEIIKLSFKTDLILNDVNLNTPNLQELFFSACTKGNATLMRALLTHISNMCLSMPNSHASHIDILRASHEAGIHLQKFNASLLETIERNPFGIPEQIFGRFAFLTAARSGDIDMVKILLEHNMGGANYRRAIKETYALMGVEANFEPIDMALREADDGKWLAIDIAAQLGHAEIVKILIESGATDPDFDQAIIGHFYLNISSMASSTPNLDIARMLNGYLAR